MSFSEYCISAIFLKSLGGFFRVLKSAKNLYIFRKIKYDYYRGFLPCKQNCRHIEKVCKMTVNFRKNKVYNKCMYTYLNTIQTL